MGKLWTINTLLANLSYISCLLAEPGARLLIVVPVNKKTEQVGAELTLNACYLFMRHSTQAPSFESRRKPVRYRSLYLFYTQRKSDSGKSCNLTKPREPVAMMGCEFWFVYSFYDTSSTPIEKGVSCKPKYMRIEWNFTVERNDYTL